MVLSGSQSVSFYDNSGFSFIVEWTGSQSIANNRTTVTTRSYISSRGGNYTINSSTLKKLSVRINGVLYTKNVNISVNSGQKKLLWTKSANVSHNSNGSKSFNIAASLNMNITLSKGHIGLVSIPSKSFTLDTIPRASDFTAFSLNNSNLQQSTSRTIRYTIGRKSSSFSHQMTLKHGNKTIDSWSTSGNGSLTRTLSSSNVNEILKRINTSTSGTLKLTMQTRNGSKNVGSSKTRSTSVSVHSSVAPSASGLNVSISGSGYDSTIGKYVQSISRVQANFSSSAGYGASVSSRKIVVKKKSNSANSQTISGSSGTTSGRVTQSGTYSVVATIKDGRGRTASVSQDITIHAYKVPEIETFNTDRDDPSTNVKNVIKVKWSNLSGDNQANIVVKRGSSTLYSNIDNSSGSLDTTQIYENQSDTESFTYILEVTDQFGKKNTSESTVGTSFMELTIAKNQGVGIGKVWEQGSLDVGGPIYADGSIHLTGVLGNLADQEGLNFPGGHVAYVGHSSGSLYISANRDGISDPLVLSTHDDYGAGRNLLVLQDDGYVRFPHGLLLSGSSGATRVLEFPGGNMISSSDDQEYFYFYGNRKNGYSFTVRSHEDKSGYRNDFRISKSGYIYMPQTYNNTSSNSENVRISKSSSEGSDHYRLYRTTSASKYKMLIETVNIDPYLILLLDPKSWYDKGNVERHSEELSRRANGEDFTADVEEKGLRRNVGLKAEDLVEAGLELYVDYGHEGEVEGIHYDRLWTLLIPIVRDILSKIKKIFRRLRKLTRRFRWLRNRINNQQDEINDLKQRIQQLEGIIDNQGS